MFKTIKSKFFATAGIMVALFALGYGALSFYLGQQNELAAQIIEDTALEREIHALNKLFHEIRFWEIKILGDENPKASAQFSLLIKEIQQRLSRIKDSQTRSHFLPRLTPIQTSLTAYEQLFNRFIQLKTSRNLHFTYMDTKYQSLSSNILTHQKDELLRPLFNLNHFYMQYLISQTHHTFQALSLVSDHMKIKIEAARLSDDRTLAYLEALKQALEKDYELNLEMETYQTRFDAENEKLTRLFETVFNESETHLNASFEKAQLKRKKLTTYTLIITIALSIALLFIFFIFSKSIVGPIRSIAIAMAKIKTGDKKARFVYAGRRDDELTQFGYYFNSMLDSLQESEKKYEQLFESSIDAILLYDPQKGYLDCNPAAMKLFAFESKEDFLTLNIMDLSPEIQPDGTPSIEKNNQERINIQTHGSSLSEWTLKRLNGETFSASVLATRVTIGSQVLILTNIRDITEYKQAQEMMIQSEKMLSVGGLAAGMAHEINNPLAGMLQTADLLRMRLTHTTLEANLKAARELGISMSKINAFMEKRDILRMLENIKSTGIRLAGIVNNMLSFARKTNDQMSSQNLMELMDKTFDLATTDFDLKKHYDFKTIQIEKNYAPDLPLVPCEASKIQQVLLNILRNGAQAMQDGAVASPKFTITICAESGFARIEITDNGPGMDKATAARIFEPFYTTKPVGVGTGLGLSVSYFIITETHKGELSVRSEPGKGASFIIKLPLQ